MNRPVFLATLTVFSVLLLSVLFSPDFSDFGDKVSTYHTENALEDTKAPNVVATIVWDYRAYDTLGEETILFAATLGIYALFRKSHKKGRPKVPSLIPKKIGGVKK